MSDFTTVALPDISSPSKKKSQVIATIQSGLLFVLIIASGFYAGLHFTSLMNPAIFGIINPAGDLMPSVQWAESWQITDGFMGARMRVFGPQIGILYLLTIGLFSGQWRKPVLWLLVGAFALFFGDLFFTIQNQVPINKYIQTLNFDHLTADQIHRINALHPLVIANFEKREMLAIVSFVLVALTPFLRSNSH